MILAVCIPIAGELSPANKTGDLKVTKNVLNMTLSEIFAQAYNELDRNEIPQRQMFQCIIDNADWKRHSKANDAIQRATQIDSLTKETVAIESDVSGKVTMMPGSSPVGAPHYNEYDVERLIQYAERDEHEAQAHEKFFTLLTKAFLELTKDKYQTKAERKGTAYKSKTNVNAWLSKRLPTAAE